MRLRVLAKRIDERIDDRPRSQLAFQVPAHAIRQHQ